jgi:hypothetical protein
MGLDMYLHREVFVSGEDNVRDVLDETPYRGPVSPSFPTANIRFTVAYWRKANAIHKWFVDNVQGGVDECQTVTVTQDQLRDLLRTCQQVLKVARIAKGQPVVHGYTLNDGEWLPRVEQGRAALNGEELAEILPTQAGFFFGDTNYSQWYLDDVADTVEMLTEILDDPDLKQYDYVTYTASW